MAREKLKLFQIKILARVLHLPSYYFRSTESGLEYQIEFQNLAKVQAKTVVENWDSLDHTFFRNKTFLFFKIES